MSNKPDFIDEEQNYLLNSLLTLTKKNPAIWECIEYNPLSFLSSEEDDGTISACIVQMFVFQAEINRVEFELELSEHIDIATGKGDIYLTLEKQSPASYDEIDAGLSFETEYEDCPAEQIQSHFGNHVVAQMADALVPPALKSEAATSALQWAIFNVEGGTPLKFEESSLYKLGESLFDSHRFLEFHRCVLDCSYREKLLAELNQNVKDVNDHGN